MLNIGEDTYRSKVGPKHFKKGHESQLRAPGLNIHCRHVSLDYTAHEAKSDNDYAKEYNYTVDKILAQRLNASAPGGVDFKVRWQGNGPLHDTWEPVSFPVPRINTPFIEHVCRHRTKLEVSDLEALTRANEAMGDLSSP